MHPIFVESILRDASIFEKCILIQKKSKSLCPLEKSASYSRKIPKKKMHTNQVVQPEMHLKLGELHK
jgi:hypothetical protein